MLTVIPDYPLACIGDDERYLWVSEGWAAAYSPGQTPDWWAGRCHVETFDLPAHPDWHEAWTRCRAGVPVLRADVLALPGVDDTLPALWMLLPALAGRSLIAVIDATRAVDEVRALASRGA